MKLVLTHYLRSLREREELDAILPDLLAESGFEVLTRPRRGTGQAGVDVAAVGPNPDRDNVRSLFLFTIKSGDLTREHWDTGQQAVRPSLNQVLDDYIPNRIPPHLSDLPIVICVCMGGEMRENVRAQWSGFCRTNEKATVHFAEWNGERLADLILSGVLRAELIEDENRGSFQKALAMLDHPDIAYRHFRDLLNAIFTKPKNQAERTRQLRKTYLCLWVLFVWARDTGNLEAAYRASELVLLRSWPHCDNTRLRKGPIQRERLTHFDQVLKLHNIIAHLLLVEKIGPFADKRYALSMAVNSRNAVDINIALFETLGRLSLHGLWLDAMSSSQDEAFSQAMSEGADKVLNIAIGMLNANPVLAAPVRDDFTIELTMFMRLADVRGRISNVADYIRGMSDHLCNGLRIRKHYPTPMTDYRDVLAHPRDRSDAYFEEHTRAGILYTFVLAWLAMIGDNERAERLRSTLLEHAPHMTHQIWIPDGQTDEVFWDGGREHGLSVPGLPLNESLEAVFDLINRVIMEHPLHERVSAVRIGLIPIFLTACRHYRMPVPPHAWQAHDRSSPDSTASDQSVSDPGMQ
ncbi:hypothetical protein [Halomonas urumqiensis]|uniref:Chemotaxis protein n=1 Tax=Halomonas urumqiensis TaxID=1684789 RepID=A0A2N7UP35_9GAMM|nr:hypothetical protein [Halomonas urumqiensis]PMR82213.1 hypothetical protein C1H70_03230 [Halomonas urumqiensis]PTB03010.1 hypothetical protein C6V82_00285 [Halomonas urumqiensis]GHE20868.1 hypothetical protein GCM10017767_13890 [Halomonas urumqiensis]